MKTSRKADGKSCKDKTPLFFQDLILRDKKAGHIHFCMGDINIVVSVGAKNII